MATATAVDYIVDPVTGFAGEYQSASQTVVLLSPESERGKVVPVATFVARNTDAQPLRCEPADFPQLSTRLREKVVALDFFLMLFDADIRTSTKVSIVQRLDELFAINEVRFHVLDIVYAAPLPASACFDFVAQNSSLSLALEQAREFVACQDRIRNLHVIWVSMRGDERIREIGDLQLTGLLVAASFFRETVLEVTTPADVTRVQQHIKERLQRAFDAQFLLEVLQSYLQTIPINAIPRISPQSRPEEPTPPSPRRKQQPPTVPSYFTVDYLVDLQTGPWPGDWHGNSLSLAQTNASIGNLRLDDRIFLPFVTPKRAASSAQSLSEYMIPAMTYDSSTLGGNSGSAIIDVRSGEVVGLHFAGTKINANYYGLTDQKISLETHREIAAAFNDQIRIRGISASIVHKAMIQAGKLRDHGLTRYYPLFVEDVLDALPLQVYPQQPELAFAFLPYPSMKLSPSIKWIDAGQIAFGNKISSAVNENNRSIVAFGAAITSNEQVGPVAMRYFIPSRSLGSKSLAILTVFYVDARLFLE